MRQNKFVSKFKAIIILGCFLVARSSLSTPVDSPTFSPSQGKYHTPISVTIECSTPDAKIYYTTDGTLPTTASDRYAGLPIVVSNHVSGDSVTFSGDNDPDSSDEYYPLTSVSMTIKAIAVKDGMENSAVVSASYVIDLVDATFNIPYDDPPTAGGTKHQLDIYQPRGMNQTPVLLFIHGGAWKSGDKNMYMELGNTFSGYYHFTTVVANYELSTDPWNAIHPQHIEDVAKAFAWVYHHIEQYGGDPGCIFFLGQSAGAHLVSLLATDGSYLQKNGLAADKIKGVISMSGAYDLYDLVKWPFNPLGLSSQDALMFKAICFTAFGSWDEDVLDGASPAKFVNPGQPSFCMINLNESATFNDMPGFGKEANNFYDQIKALNGPLVEMKLLDEADIPQEILDIDFTGGAYDGHYEEIFAINTRYWNCVPTKMVAEFISPAVGVKEGRRVLPKEWALEQNYPNPFNPTTTIRFSLPQREHVTLKVFDVLGREVATLVDKEFNAGEHSVVFNTTNLPSGVYFYQLTTPAFSQTKSMEVIK